MSAQAQRCEAALDALGSPVRRHICTLLADGPLAVGEIAGQLPISRPAVSKHLRLLEGAGLVTFDPLGNRNVYRLEREGFDAARSWLGSFWDDALRRFALAAENLSEEGA